MTVLTFPGGFDLSKPWLFETEGAASAALFLAHCLDLAQNCAVAVLKSAADKDVAADILAELKEIWRGKLRDDLGRVFETAKVEDRRVQSVITVMVIEAFDAALHVEVLA